MKFFGYVLFAFLFLIHVGLQAQIESQSYRYSYYIQGKDTILTIELPTAYVFAPAKPFASNAERLEFTKMARDIQKTLPYAKMVAASIIETYQFMETLPNEKSKQKHLETVQKEMMETYKPKMKKLTKTQGKVLIKLIDRECNTSSYNIVKALMGDLKAITYNTFAGLFGNSLKTKYDPEGKDKEMEKIVRIIEQGNYDYYYSLTY